MYKHILVATDGSELAGKALSEGLALAKALGSRVTIVTASEPWSAVMTGEMAVAYPIEEYEKAIVANAEAILAKASQVARQAGVTADIFHAKEKFAADAIIETAEQRGCDLIVMASHGRRGFSRLLLGSQTHNVVTRGTTPVLVCR